MKKFTAFIFLLALTLSVNAQTTGEEQTQRRALFERKNKDIPAKYMQGGVTEVDGKVTWAKTYNVEGQNALQVYDKELAYFSNLVKSDNQTKKSTLASVDRVDHKLLVRAQE